MSGSARVGAGSTCINLSEERYKHREWLIEISDGSQEESTFIFKPHINILDLRCVSHTRKLTQIQ